MGGRGSWYVAYRNPNVFAAVAPICGWITHRVVPVIGSREPAAAFKDAGSKARYTEYLGTDDNSRDATYASKEFTDWLFAQHRSWK